MGCLSSKTVSLKEELTSKSTESEPQVNSHIKHNIKTDKEMKVGLR